MNYFDLYSSYPDRTIAAAWDSQVKEADNTPWLAGTLTRVRGRAVCALCGVLRGAARPTPQRAACAAASACTLQRAGRDLAGVLAAGRATTAAQDGLVVGRRCFTARAWARSGDGGDDHCHHKRSKDHTRWTVFTGRGHRERQ